MNDVLVDTSILVRLANLDDPLHSVAAQTVSRLHQTGHRLLIAPQNLIEFRSVATRPIASNGLGLAAVDAESKSAAFEELFDLAPEVPEIFPAWKKIVSEGSVIGKQVHDARLVAACHVHKIKTLLTFNASHFRRLANTEPDLRITEPVPDANQ